MPRAPERSGRASGPWRSSDDETMSASAVGRMKRGAWIVAVITSGCLVDLDDRCGPHQELVANNVCTCVAGSVLTDSGCVPCGPNEEASAGGCVCAPGFARPAPSAECAPAGIGAPCAGDAECSEAAAPVCHRVDDADGYCTRTGCAATADCPDGFACNTSGEPSVCERPPVGQGQTCETHADCAGTAATFCESLFTHQCLVQGCVDDGDCFGAWQCCDVRPLGVSTALCVPAGECPTR